MNITLWIIQAILATIFAVAGVMKSTQPVEKLLTAGIIWADRFPLIVIRVIGLCELLGAFGLILPWASNTAPFLTPSAAAAIVLLQFLAALHHSKHKEGKAVAFNIVLLCMAAFVYYGRTNIL